MLHAVALPGSHPQGLSRHVFDRTHNLLLKQQRPQQHDHRSRNERHPPCGGGDQRGGEDGKKHRHYATHPPAQRHGRQFTQPALSHHQSFMNTFLTAAVIQRAVERLHGGYLFRRGFGADRHIARHLPVTHHWHRIRAHPVVVTVFAPIFDNPAPRFPLLQGVPHIGKGGFWHIRVAHHIVRLARQLIKRVTAHLHKRVVGVGNVAVDVCGRH